VVSILASHAGYPGSSPGIGITFAFWRTAYLSFGGWQRKSQAWIQHLIKVREWDHDRNMTQRRTFAVPHSPVLLRAKGADGAKWHRTTIGEVTLLACHRSVVVPTPILLELAAGTFGLMIFFS
jgi:hypothetical protein